MSEEKPVVASNKRLEEIRQRQERRRRKAVQQYHLMSVSELLNEIDYLLSLLQQPTSEQDYTEDVEHVWTDGPDGSKYHCAICGISKRDDHACWNTCRAWLREKAKRAANWNFEGEREGWVVYLTKAAASERCGECVKCEHDSGVDERGICKWIAASGVAHCLCKCVFPATEAPALTARERWLLHDASSVGRLAIQTEQYDELRALAQRLATTGAGEEPLPHDDSHEDDSTLYCLTCEQNGRCGMCLRPKENTNAN